MRHAVSQTRAEISTDFCPLFTDDFFQFFDASRVVIFDAPFQVCQKLLYGIEIRRVRMKFDATHSIVVKPATRGSSTMVAGVVLEVEPPSVGPRTKCMRLHVPRHVV